MAERKMIYLDDAINAMRQYSHYDDFDMCVIDESVAIKALKDLPHTEPEQPVARDINVPTNDCISRQSAIDALKAMAVPLHLDMACEDIWERDRTLDNAIDVMRGLPPAQPERKKGVWIKDCCSICGYGVEPWNNTPYCPNCGADMRGDS